VQACFPQWTLQDLDTQEDLLSTHYRSSSNVWIGAFDTIYWRGDQATDFIKRPTVSGGGPIFGSYDAIHALDDNTAFISGVMNTGTAELIFRTANGGNTWTLSHFAEIGPIDLLLDIKFPVPPLGFAVGSNGRILRNENGDNTWTPVASGTTATFEHIVHAGGTNYLVGGANGLKRSTNSGLTWNNVTGPSSAKHLVAIGSVCYAVSNNVLWRSSNGGNAWNQVGPFFMDVLEIIETNTLIAGDDSGLYRSTTGGQYWERYDLPDHQPIVSIDFLDPLKGIAVGRNGYVIMTENAGGPTIPMATMTAPGSGPVCVNSQLVFTTDPAPFQTVRWFVNGVSQSIASTFTTSFAVPGTYSVDLVVYNSNSSDTASTTVSVVQALPVAPFTLTVPNDSVCTTSSITISLPASAVGTTYTLFNGTAAIGTAKPGTGNALTFPTGILPGSAVFSVLGRRVSPCGVDSLFVQQPITVLNTPPPTNFALEVDSLCLPAFPVLRIDNALSGYSYRYLLDPNYGPFVNGEDTTLLLTPPYLLEGSVYVYRVSARHNVLGCTWLVPGRDTLRVFSPAFSTTLADTLVMEGAPLVFSASPQMFDQVNWDFGNGAVPEQHSGPTPPEVVYATAGTRTVTLRLELGDSLCTAERTATITVVPPAPVFPMTGCESGSASGGFFISDFYLDTYNNRYITGQYHGGGGNIVQKQFFVMKLDSAGNELWQYRHPITPSNASYGLGITADEQGNTYVSGILYYDPWPVQDLVVPHDNFVLKFDRQGRVAWGMSSPALSFRGLVCHSDQRIYITGHGAWNDAYVQLPSGQPITFPGGASDPANGAAFVMVLTKEGGLLDFDSFGRATNPDSPGLASPIDFAAGTSDPALQFRSEPRISATPAGDLLISGTMASMRSPWIYDFDGVVLNTQSALDTALNIRQVFGARYTPQQGSTEAFILFGGGIEGMQRMAMDDAGTYWVCGRLRNTLIGNNTIHEHGDPSTVGPYNGYVARANANGDLLWHIATPQWDPYDLAIEADGTARVLSAFASTGLFPSTQNPVQGLASAGGADRAIVHFSANGALQSVDHLATAASEVGYRMATDPCGKLHVAKVSGFTGAYSFTSAMPCIGCTDNVRFEVLGTNPCAPNCYSAFDPSRRDAALDRLTLSDTSYTTPGDRQILVKVASNSLTPINSIVFGYRANGGSVYQSTWNGTLNYGDTISDLVIGSLPFGDAHYYTIEAWIESVNGTQDDDPLNDTLQVEQLMCTTPLAGTYTLGAVEDDFPSFAAANACLVQCGIAGTTHFAIRDGHYYDQMGFGAINGTSNTDTIVFRSASGDSAAVHLWLRRRMINNATLISFSTNARHLTLKDLSMHALEPDVTGSSLIFLGQCEAINIQGCLLEKSSQGGYLISPSSSVRCKRINIENNTFRFGFHGIYKLSNSSQIGNDSAIVIRNNYFDRQRREVLLWNQKVEGLLIEGNRFFASPGYSGGDYEAIYAGGQGGPIRVTGNTILRLMQGGPGTTFMRLGSGNSVPGRSLVANNIIMDPYSIGSVALRLAGNGGPMDIVHNTFGTSVQITGNPITDVTFKNNIIASNDLVMWVGGSDPQPGLVLNNNVYWSSDNSLNGAWFSRSSGSYDLGVWNSTFGWDMQSQLQPVDFIAPDDLHLASGNDFTCIMFPGVTTDIDGDIRNNVTRQGADQESITVGRQEDSEASATLSAFPIPFQRSIQISGIPVDASALEVVDAAGRRVHHQSLIGYAEHLSVDLPDLSAGVFLLRVMGPEGPLGHVRLLKVQDQ
jgi:photosystem II stability/assembly factor-like uncharacterized protein/PKD repeat protein